MGIPNGLQESAAVMTNKEVLRYLRSHIRPYMLITVLLKNARSDRIIIGIAIMIS